MSWRKKEIEMVNELNEKVFNKDPLREYLRHTILWM